uniref:uncharacterized protein LOC120343339 n=1 Tax=Styela clava TaxID=7725 RepID=UPI00193A6A21|nr:uncharacterized protein LOC120343339 [Styela clava]
MNNMLLSSHITSYVLPKNFNRKYNVSIQARTCAGFGTESKAVGKCATDTNAPSNIQAPSTRSEITNSGILEFSIHVPDETNGPISCYFIIVQVNKTSNTSAGFNNARMSKLNNSEIEDEYIAIALNRTSKQNHAYVYTTCYAISQAFWNTYFPYKALGITVRK